MPPVRSLDQAPDAHLCEVVVAKVKLCQGMTAVGCYLYVLDERGHGLIREVVFVKPQGRHPDVLIPEPLEKRVERGSSPELVPRKVDRALGIAILHTEAPEKLWQIVINTLLQQLIREL